MASQLTSLAVILLVAALAPFVASLVPGRAIPSVVFLVFAGAILGPSGLGLIQPGEPLRLLSELGMAFLFLMAGYEIHPQDLTGRMGRHASLAWFASLGIALLYVAFAPYRRFTGIAGMAFAIMLTTTAYGTLAPIMRTRGLTETRMGRALTVYACTGEVLPVLAMAFLLSARSKLQTLLEVVAFTVVCVLLALMPRRTERWGSRLREFLRSSAGSSTQSILLFVELLLVFLLVLAKRFSLDSVLGAFAAGFVLRQLIPDGDKVLESKLDAIGSGFLIPVFFVVSGAGIDLAAVFSDPGLVVVFIALLVVVRGVVVAVSLRVCPETRDLTWQETLACATYCSMALPLVVAITNVAVEAGAMSSADASVLVTGGAITVLVMPVLTSFVRVTADAHPVEAVREIAHGDHTAGEVIHQHRVDSHRAHERFRELDRRTVKAGPHLSSAEYFARVNDPDAPEDQ